MRHAKPTFDKVLTNVTLNWARIGGQWLVNCARKPRVPGPNQVTVYA